MLMSYLDRSPRPIHAVVLQEDGNVRVIARSEATTVSFVVFSVTVAKVLKWSVDTIGLLTSTSAIVANINSRIGFCQGYYSITSISSVGLIQICTVLFLTGFLPLPSLPSNSKIAIS